MKPFLKLIGLEAHQLQSIVLHVLRGKKTEQSTLSPSLPYPPRPFSTLILQHSGVCPQKPGPVNKPTNKTFPCRPPEKWRHNAFLLVFTQSTPQNGAWRMDLLVFTKQMQLFIQCRGMQADHFRDRNRSESSQIQHRSGRKEAFWGSGCALKRDCGDGYTIA